MVKVMITAKFPTHKAPEVTKAYLSPDKPKYPAFIKKLFQWGVNDFDPKSIAIYEIDDDKMLQGLIALAEHFKHYSKIEGYKYKADVLIEEKDLVKMFK